MGKKKFESSERAPKEYSEEPQFAGTSGLFTPFTQERETFRPAKIANRIREELLLLIPDSLKDPRMQKFSSITITNVVCAADLRNARVTFALYENEEKFKEAEGILNKAASFLRGEIHERLGTKYTPILSFHFDKGMVHAQRINQILKQSPDSES